MRKKLRIEEGVSLIPTSQNSTTKGDISTKTADEKLHVYLDGADRSVVTENQAQTITNKTIDVDNNTLSNVETDNLKSGVLNTSTTLASASDTQLPSALAVKTYVDAGDVANAGAIGTVATDLANHIANPTDAHDASAISTTPISGVTGTDVQANLASLKSLIDAGGNGDVMGPASSTDNAVARFDSTTGKIIQNSSVTLSDLGVVAGFTIDTATNGITNLDNANFKVNAMIDAVKIADGSVTNAEFQRLDGVTSPIQTQIDSKVNTTGGSVITPARLDAKQDTLANLTTYALTATNGQFAFSTDTKETFVVKDGQLTSFASSGSGGINYITNYTADTNINGWITYADAAGTSPVDGTGGTPTVTLTRSTSLPLRGNASFLYTKPASNVQGQGFSYNFTIDAADQGKVLQGSFDYQIASGTFADDAMSVWIYDVTNGRMIQPAPYLLKNSGIVERFPLEFQTAINSTSYRLIIHQSSTSAVANTIKLDNFFVGPESKLYGSAVTDPIDYTPTISPNTNATPTAKWHREGKYLVVDGKVTWTGTGSQAYIVFSLPPGLSIDVTALPSGSVGGSTYLGSGAGAQQAVQSVQSIVAYNNVTSVAIYGGVSGTPASNKLAFDSNLFASAPAAGSYMNFYFKVPILGWSSSQVMSSDASTRVVAAYASSTTLVALNTLATVITTANIIADTHAGFSGSTYVVRVPGFYKIKGSVYINNTAGSGINGYCRVVAGGYTQDVGNVYLFTGQGSTVSGEAVVPLTTGQTIQLQAYVGAGTGNAATSNSTYLSIERISGPSQILASESVDCKYQNIAAPTVNTTPTTVAFASKLWDTHNAFNGATGVFTAPISGKYLVTSKLYFTGLTLSTTQLATIGVLKNNAGHEYIQIPGNGATAIGFSTQITTMVDLLAGENIRVQTYTNGSTSSLTSSPGFNTIGITKIGNY